MGDQTRILFIVLFFIYLIITIFCVFRLWRMHTFAKDSYLAKFFYITLAIQNLSSSIGLLLLAIFMPDSIDDTEQQEDDNEKQLVFVLSVIPDMVFPFSYLVLFW